jgi:transposase
MWSAKVEVAMGPAYEAQRRSGLSLAEFCRRRALRKGTVSFWKWKLAREAEVGAGRGATASFVPIQIAVPRRSREPGAPAAPLADLGKLEIALADGRLVRVRGRVDPPWLAAVVRAVEARGC